MKNQRTLLIFLIFPLIGFAGLVMVLLGEKPTAPTQVFQVDVLPTPQPLRTTPVPTVTTRPVLEAPAPENPLTTLEGEAFALADLRGQVVVVNFWATWCPPCVREMPTLQAFAAENPQVVVLAITDPNDGQTPTDIQAFIAEYALENLQFGLDERGMLRLNFNAYNLPTTFILDAAGVVRFRQIGEVTAADLAYYLGELS